MIRSFYSNDDGMEQDDLQSSPDSDDLAVITDASPLMNLSESWFAHALYIVLFFLLVAASPQEALDGLWDIHSPVLVGIGVLAVWRYSWGLLHFFRSFVYRKRVFPRWRRRADDAVAESLKTQSPPHAFLLVTSFRVDGDTSASVYRAVFEAARRAPGGATVVASLVELGDQRLVTNMHRLICGEESDVNLTIVRINGSGKRDALAFGFRAIAKAQPEEDDVVAVIDGDSIVPRDLVSKCIGFFRADPKVGALTTDESSQVRGGAAFHIWYSLRFAQRHVLMSSNGLSGRVLTLTGRMSMFRAGVICDPDFVAQVEHDSVDHWRLGEIKFLTGDDKSSWFWLLKKGYKMLYVPDVMVSTVEDPPGTKFIPAAAQLMVRWFGNMLRTNGRALALGPRKIGFFTWWAIFDQRISMWTSLTGLMMVVLVGLFVTPYAFLGYFIWMALTRYLITLSLFTVRRRVSALYPFFIYFNQIFGSIIKTYIFFRLNRQKWTRQNTVLAGNGSRWHAGFVRASSLYMHVLAIVIFVTAVAWLVGQLPTPEPRLVFSAFGQS